MENVTIDVLQRKEGMGTILKQWLSKENSATKKIIYIYKVLIMRTK